jgi:AmmeMemoRadiSam system protein B
MANWVRRPAVAGHFYPAQPERLRPIIAGFLAAAGGPLGPAPQAIIAPHAGYRYSGPIAASAFAALTPAASRIRRVILLGPAHYAAVRGLAASSAAAFRSPLGDVAVDGEAVATLLQRPEVQVDDAAHEPEHALEVELPFLQTILGDFAVGPLLVGVATPADVAGALAPLLADDTTVVVVSSDLSHYHPYEEARALDWQTAADIEAGRLLAEEQACGWRAINALLHLAADRRWTAQTLDLRNSGDTAGTRDSVVGYGAFVYWRAG